MVSQIIYVGGAAEVIKNISSICEWGDYTLRTITDISQIIHPVDMATFFIIDESIFKNGQHIYLRKYFCQKYFTIPILMLTDEQDLCSGLEGITLGAQSIVSVREILINSEILKKAIENIRCASYLQDINRSLMCS